MTEPVIRLQGDAGVAPDAEGDAGPDAVSPRLPASVSAGTAPAAVPLSVASRTAATLRHHARGLWLDPGRLLYVMWHGKPGSMAEHTAYLKSAAWVPEEMTGRPRAFLIAAGIAYHVLIGWPLKLAAKAIDSAAGRPLRLLALVIFVTALIVLL